MDKENMCIYTYTHIHTHTHTYTIEYYSAMIKNEILPLLFVTKGMDLEGTTRSKISQMEKDKHYNLTYMQNLKKKIKLTETEIGFGTARSWGWGQEYWMKVVYMSPLCVSHVFLIFCTEHCIGFLIAAVTNYHKLDGLTQIYPLRVLKVRSLKTVMGGLFSLEAPKENFLLAFSSWRIYLHFLADTYITPVAASILMSPSTVFDRLVSLS